MPVDSIATVVMPQPTSQSPSALRSAVKLRNVRTGSASISAGTATTWNVAPMSIPAARRWMGVSSAGARAPFLFLLAMGASGEGPGGGRAHQNTFLNGIAVRRHHCQVRNAPWTMFFYGDDITKKQPAAPPEPAALIPHPSFSSNRWGAARDGFFGARRGPRRAPRAAAAA